MDFVVKAIGGSAVVAGVLVLLCMLTAYPTMLMVNYLFTPTTLLLLFGISALTFWKAFWLNFLCCILFKGNTTTSE